MSIVFYFGCISVFFSWMYKKSFTMIALCANFAIGFSSISRIGTEPTWTFEFWILCWNIWQYCFGSIKSFLLLLGQTQTGNRGSCQRDIMRDWGIFGKDTCHTTLEGGMQRRDDRIVFFCNPILPCFWKMISVSNPHPVLVKIMLSISENYPKVYYDA